MTKVTRVGHCWPGGGDLFNGAQFFAAFTFCTALFTGTIAAAALSTLVPGLMVVTPSNPEQAHHLCASGRQARDDGTWQGILFRIQRVVEHRRG
ncbi:hypothetical protein BJ994_001846 [Arthrobacter pigmenti]|uniref:Uncharacterized protein n=1 Tax=Arthrobacter pigmenti TaxID=271432 RepID=A0A846RMC4_9MICC|nr:hypothetical protein [Arthrobacter pigmenti]NJC22770.1 hypothetical protein [Arthrobacter pigmenti]